MQDLEPPLTATAPLYLHLSVTDPETVAALSEAAEGRDRQELALTALKIGIFKYYAAYKLSAEGQDTATKLKEQVAPKKQ
jgi:hypothetical protein